MALSAGIIPWTGGVLLTGEGVARLIRLEKGTFCERLSRNFGLGLIVTSLSLFWLSLLGAPLLLSTLLGATAFWILLGWTLGKRPDSTPRENPGRGARLLLAIAALLGLIVLVACLAGPETSLDGRTHWGMCARMLWHEKGVWGGTFWDPDRLFPHRRYPLLVPLSEWSLFAYFGECDTRSVKVLFGLAWWAQMGLLWGQVRRMHRPLIAAALLLLWAGLPFPAFSQDGGAVSGYSDLCLTMFVTGGIVAALRDSPWELALWGAGALFCKREGLPLVGVGLGLLLLSRERKVWWLSAGLVTFLTLPWWIFVYSLPSDHLGAGAITGRLTGSAIANWGPRNVMRLVSQIWFEPGTWALLWWTVLTALLSPARWERAAWIPLIFILTYTPVLLMVFLPVAPEVYDWNTVNRTVMPLTSAAVLFIASRIPRESGKG